MRYLEYDVIGHRPNWLVSNPLFKANMLKHAHYAGFILVFVVYMLNQSINQSRFLAWLK